MKPQTQIVRNDFWLSEKVDRNSLKSNSTNNVKMYNTAQLLASSNY